MIRCFGYFLSGLESFSFYHYRCIFSTYKGKFSLRFLVSSASRSPNKEKSCLLVSYWIKFSKFEVDCNFVSYSISKGVMSSSWYKCFTPLSVSPKNSPPSVSAWMFSFPYEVVRFSVFFLNPWCYLFWGDSNYFWFIWLSSQHRIVICSSISVSFCGSFPLRAQLLTWSLSWAPASISDLWAADGRKMDENYWTTI